MKLVVVWHSWPLYMMCVTRRVMSVVWCFCSLCTDPAVTSALPPRQLPLRDLAFQPIRGHTDSILQLRTHRSQPLAATVDTTGSAMLWDLTSLAALGLVSDLLPDAEKDATQVTKPSLNVTAMTP